MSELKIISEDLDGCTDYRTEFEEKYFETYTIATNLLSSRNVNNPQPSTTQVARLADNNIEQPINPNEHDFTSRSTLPKINLPKLSGSYDTWLGFCDLFTSLVHNETRIPTIHKLHYLKGCLSGEAAEVIDSLTSSAENYEEAWNLLRERYDDKKIIREAHIKALLNLSPVSETFPVRLFLNNIQKHPRALEVMTEPIESWNSILIIIFRDKFDEITRDKWDEFSNDKANPTMDEMQTFLTKRAQLENSGKSLAFKTNSIGKKNIIRTNHRSRQVYSATTSKISCNYCDGDHYINSCSKFVALTPSQRYEAAKKAAWCINCLRVGHRSNQCNSGNCRSCNQKHHSLLHFDNKNDHKTDTHDGNNTGHTQSITTLHAHVSSEALLATAMVEIVNKQGQSKSCRVFLDAGSQAHFITEAIADFLNLERKRINISVTGLDNISTNITQSTCATVKSNCSNYRKNIEFLIVPRITTIMPSMSINRANLEIPKNIVLADREFHKPSNIDALIGVQLFYKLLCIGQISLKNNPNAILQKTHFGWIVAGEINNSFATNSLHCHLNIQANVPEINLTRFWDLEEISSTKSLSLEEQACENYYVNNTQRTSEGRYMVKLPFKENKLKLGESYSIAFKRLHSLEYRFKKDDNLKTNYSEFLEEYQDLDHMSPCNNQNNFAVGYYLPHHAVIKQDSITTKIRVVFDGSAKTSTGVSLNDVLMVGLKIQNDLFSILIRFRTHQFALTADIEKMYRQILVHPDDTIYKKILYRDDFQATVHHYTLDTVTYGTSSAPFLAVRTLHQLAEDEGVNHPLAAFILNATFMLTIFLRVQTRMKTLHSSATNCNHY